MMNVSNSSVDQLNDEVECVRMLTNMLPPQDATDGDALQKLDQLLSGYRQLNKFALARSARIQSIAQKTLDKKDAALAALQSEKENLSNILSRSKVDYLEELLDAERKIKKLENEVADLKNFVTHDVLSANKMMSTMIRGRFGDANGNLKIPSLHPAGEESKPINAPTEAEKAPVKPVAETSATSAEAANDESKGSDGDDTAETENVIAISDEESDETTDSSSADSSDEPDEAQMEAVKTAKLLNRFPCNECPRSFSTMAMKYRHEHRVHGVSPEQRVIPVKTVKKPLKRLYGEKQDKKDLFKLLRALKKQNRCAEAIELLEASTQTKKPSTRKAIKTAKGNRM